MQVDQNDNEAFMKILRINLLEMLNRPSVIKNLKKLSIADFLSQVKNLYQFSPRKPTREETDAAIDFLVKRRYMKISAMGDVDIYTLTERGRDVLEQLAEDDDTVII